jgi:hypothetical protein
MWDRDNYLANVGSALHEIKRIGAFFLKIECGVWQGYHMASLGTLYHVLHDTLHPSWILISSCVHRYDIVHHCRARR